MPNRALGLDPTDVSLSLVIASLEERKPLDVPLVREVVAEWDCNQLVGLVGCLVGLSAELALIHADDDREEALEFIREILMVRDDDE